MAALPDEHKERKKHLSKKSKKIEDADELKVADRVVVDKDKIGQIRWIGEDKTLGTGVHYGVRLTEKRGVCNGTVKDVRFFWCPAAYGVVVPRRRIKSFYTGDDFDFSSEEKPVDPAIAGIAEKKEEIRKMKKKFKELDASGDLVLDIKEFTKLVTGKDGLFPSLTDKEVKKLFDEIDGTASGSVSFAEFDAWCKGVGGWSVMEKGDYMQLLEKFKSMDKDGDAKLDVDEFSSAGCELFPTLGKDELISLFNLIDVSGDGTITLDEFGEWASKQE
jgi:Ca2+-binding EF-hand superfamily protein